LISEALVTQAWDQKELLREDGFVVIGALSNDPTAESINSDWHSGFSNNPWECWADTYVHSDREWDGSIFQSTPDYLSKNDNRLSYIDLVPMSGTYLLNAPVPSITPFSDGLNSMDWNFAGDAPAQMSVSYLSSWDEEYARIQVEVNSKLYGVED